MLFYKITRYIVYEVPLIRFSQSLRNNFFNGKILFVIRLLLVNLPNPKLFSISDFNVICMEKKTIQR